MHAVISNQRQEGAATGFQLNMQIKIVEWVGGQDHLARKGSKQSYGDVDGWDIC